MPLFAIALLGGIEMIFCREKLIIISRYLPKLVVKPHEDLIHGFVILKTVQKNVLKFPETSKISFFFESYRSFYHWPVLAEYKK